MGATDFCASIHMKRRLTSVMQGWGGSCSGGVGHVMLNGVYPLGEQLVQHCQD